VTDRVLALTEGEPRPIGGTAFIWAELRWAARHEQVAHLEDLLLRRTRIGLLLPEGGAHLLDAIKAAVQSDLGWSDERWLAEAAVYRETWRHAYSPALLG